MKSSGYIYFIQMGDDGPIKIGFAKDTANLCKRLNTMQIGNPTPLFLRGVLRGPQSMEKKVHQSVWQHRLRGEWFASADDIDAVLERCEPVDGLPVVQRRAHADRMHQADAERFWRNETLTEAEALERMTGWTQYYARRFLGERTGRPNRHEWTPEKASEAARKSHKNREKPQRAPEAEARKIWFDTRRYNVTADALLKLRDMGWSKSAIYTTMGGRWTELNMGRPRKPKT